MLNYFTFLKQFQGQNNIKSSSLLRKSKQIYSEFMCFLIFITLISSVYLINRLPTPVLNQISPWKKAFKVKPDYNFLKIFISVCLPYYQSHKFQQHSTKCVFLGYNKSHNGYKCFSSSGTLYISRLQFPNYVTTERSQVTISLPNNSNFPTYTVSINGETNEFSNVEGEESPVTAISEQFVSYQSLQSPIADTILRFHPMQTRSQKWYLET